MSCPYMREERGTGLKTGHYKEDTARRTEFDSA